MKGIGRFSLMCFILGCLLAQSLYADPPMPTPVGRVAWVRGQLKAVMPNQEERSLQKMSLIYLHDILVTDAQSQAQIVFSDESLVTFYPGTRFSIEQYELQQRSKKQSFGKIAMRLLEGGFRTITGLIAKNSPNDYQMNTPVATIGVRGTDYAVYLKNKKLYVGYYQGKPCVFAKDKSKTALCLNAQTRYASVSEGAVPVPLSIRPEVFKETLEVTSTKIEQFNTLSDIPSNTPNKTRGGAATSFCITQ